jgi:hypothetical protein
MSLEGRADGATGALIPLVGEGLDPGSGQGVDQAGGPGRGEVVGGSGQCR